MHVPMPIVVFPRANHRWCHGLPTLSLDVNAHRLPLQFHAEAGDIRQTHDEIKLLQVDHNKGHLLTKGRTDLQMYANLSLGGLEGTVAIHDSQKMCRLVHLKAVAACKLGVNERDTRASVVQPHCVDARPPSAQRSRDLQ